VGIAPVMRFEYYQVLPMKFSEWSLQQMRPAIRAFHRGKWPEHPKKDTPPRDAETLYREWMQRNRK